MKSDATASRQDLSIPAFLRRGQAMQQAVDKILKDVPAPMCATEVSERVREHILVHGQPQTMEFARADNPFDFTPGAINLCEGASVMSTPKPEKKKRTVVELPTHFSDGTAIAHLSLAELVEKKAAWEKVIEGHDKQKLELRAIQSVIRQKAGVAGA